MQVTKNIIRQNITAWPELGINYWGINKNATSTFINHFNILCNNLTEDQVHAGGGQKGKAISKSRYIDKTVALNNGLKNFAIVRDPGERFKSCYKQFKYSITPEQEFSSRKARFLLEWSPDDFLLYIEKLFLKNNKGNKHFWKQTWFITEPLKIDYIIKLESLETSWPFEFPLPNFKSNISSTKTNNIIYNKEKLYEIYKDDFVTFNY